MSTLSQRRANLPQFLRQEGLRLVLAPNWKNGRPGRTLRPRAIQVHWTATPSASPSNPRPTSNVVRNGWGSLPGPLYHILVGQDGVVELISVNAANHSGRGNSAALSAASASGRRLAWNHRPGADNASPNDLTYAVSADHSGSGQMPAAQRDAMVRVLAALIRFERSCGGSWGANRIYHHASSTRRKIDVRGWPDLVPLVETRLRQSPSASTDFTSIELGDRVLREGDRGEDVSELQRLLNTIREQETNHRPEGTLLTVDGIFGTYTRWEVIRWGERAGLTFSDTTDPRVGAATVRALRSLVQEEFIVRAEDKKWFEDTLIPQVITAILGSRPGGGRPVSSLIGSGGRRLDELPNPHRLDGPVVLSRIEDMLHQALRGVTAPSEIPQDSTVVIVTNDVDEGLGLLVEQFLRVPLVRWTGEKVDAETAVLIGAAGNLTAEQVGVDEVVTLQGSNRQETAAVVARWLEEEDPLLEA